MRYILYFICLLFLIISSKEVYPQDDGKEIQLTKKQYRFLYDEYAVTAIKLLARLDTLNNKLDSLKALDSIYQGELEECENEMYSSVETSKDGIVEYRKKFEETENKINERVGAPANSRKLYFDEISSGKIKCLPEFSNRFISMKKKLEEWEGTNTMIAEIKTVQPIEEKYTQKGNYTVKEGDNLWIISMKEYNTPDFWYVIWEANKDGVVNKDYFYYDINKYLTDPDFIYPGQILKIPDIKHLNK
jgi:hypothetical protein